MGSSIMQDVPNCSAVSIEDGVPSECEDGVPSIADMRNRVALLRTSRDENIVRLLLLRSLSGNSESFTQWLSHCRDSFEHISQCVQDATCRIEECLTNELEIARDVSSLISCAAEGNNWCWRTHVELWCGQLVDALLDSRPGSADQLST